MTLRIWIINIAAVLSLAVYAEAATLNGECTIRFSGKSTLHDFAGQAVCQPFVLQTEDAESGRQVVRQQVVTVLVSEMDTDNDGRDKKMRAMFDSTSFPEIKGHFADLEPEVVLKQLKATENGQGSLEFDLQIRKITQHIKAKTSLLTIGPEQIVFTMEFPLSLASFELKPPSVMGIIRVADDVQVEVQTTLYRQPSAKGSAAEKEQ